MNYSNNTPDRRYSTWGRFKVFNPTHTCKQGGYVRHVCVLRIYKKYADVKFDNGSTARVYTSQLTELHPGVPSGGDDGGIPKA